MLGITIDINIHLVDNVRDLGPLYTRDCFSFEEKSTWYLVSYLGLRV